MPTDENVWTFGRGRIVCRTSGLIKSSMRTPNPLAWPRATRTMTTHRSGRAFGWHGPGSGRDYVGTCRSGRVHRVIERTMQIVGCLSLRSLCKIQCVQSRITTMSMWRRGKKLFGPVWMNSNLRLTMCKPSHGCRALTHIDAPDQTCPLSRHPHVKLSRVLHCNSCRKAVRGLLGVCPDGTSSLSWIGLGRRNR